jgi:phage terminase small subunit
MGRNAMPVDLLVLNGKKNLTKKEIEQRKEAEQKLQPKQDNIRCPSWLDKEAKKEWKRIVNDLKELNLLTNIDVAVLALYCDAYSKYVQATENINAQGVTIEYTNKAKETNII